MISIVLSTDNGYAQHAGVALASAALNTGDPAALRCYVLDCGISDRNRKAMEDCARTIGFELRILTPDLTAFGELPHRRYGPAAWARLLIPELLPETRAIYLDCDVIVEADVAELWNTDMNGHPVAAVCDGLLQPRLGIDPRNYFNSGVLLMDLELWRQQGLTTQLLTYAEQNSEALEYPDQDALNGLLHQHWQRLAPRWNASAAVFAPENHAAMAAATGYDLKDIEDAYYFPAVIHYSSPRRRKPWMFRSFHPLAHRYWKYLRATPWRDYVPPDRTIVGHIQRYLRRKDVARQGMLRRMIETRNPLMKA